TTFSSQFECEYFLMRPSSSGLRRFRRSWYRFASRSGTRTECCSWRMGGNGPTSVAVYVSSKGSACLSKFEHRLRNAFDNGIHEFAWQRFEGREAFTALIDRYFENSQILRAIVILRGEQQSFHHSEKITKKN
ncbi:hypothetical protein PMAYCL1PPCAC_20003, partial [Pristionchus mayeri]